MPSMSQTRLREGCVSVDVNKTTAYLNKLNNIRYIGTEIEVGV